MRPPRGAAGDTRWGISMDNGGFRVLSALLIRGTHLHSLATNVNFNMEECNYQCKSGALVGDLLIRRAFTRHLLRAKKKK